MLKVAADDIMRTPWMARVEPFCIVDNMYFVGDKDVCSHLFDTGEGLLLVDTGYPYASYLLFESIRELGFDPKDVKWILHSHGHLDHFGATRIFAERYGTKTYFPEIDLPLLDEKKELNWYGELNQNYEPPYDQYFVPDVLINPGDVLQFGNTKVEVFAAGGHTPGTVCYRFTLPGGLKAAMHGGIGMNTMSSAYAKKWNLGTTWRDNFRRDIRNLYGLEVDIVLGNHTSQNGTLRKRAGMTEEVNPFIDPTEWDQFLSRVEKRFLELVEKDPI